MMMQAAALALLVTMALAIVRALLGPTLFDRILAVNMFGTKTVLFISLLAGVTGRGDYLDVALVYAMINFIATIALMKYFDHGHLGRPRPRPEQQP